MFQKAEVLYFVFFVTRNVKLGFWGFWQVESEPRKPKSVKIQPKMVSHASEGDLMCLGSLPVPLIDSSCTQTRSRISRMVHMHVINLVIIFITEIYYIKLNTVSANGNHDRSLIWCTVGLGVKSVAGNDVWMNFWPGNHICLVIIL